MRKVNEIDMKEDYEKRLKGLQEQRTPSKVGITEYRHFFNVITNIMDFYERTWKRYADATKHHFNQLSSD